MCPNVIQVLPQLGRLVHNITSAHMHPLSRAYVYTQAHVCTQTYMHTLHLQASPLDFDLDLGPAPSSSSAAPSSTSTPNNPTHNLTAYQSSRGVIVQFACSKPKGKAGWDVHVNCWCPCYVLCKSKTDCVVDATVSTIDSPARGHLALQPQLSV